MDAATVAGYTFGAETLPEAALTADEFALLLDTVLWSDEDVRSAPFVPLRYIIAFIAPISFTIKPFLAAKGHPADEVERMYAAWCKVVVLQVTLWSAPFAQAGLF